jgi:hypothetical protein
VSALTGTGFTLFKDASGGKFARNFFGTAGCGQNYLAVCSPDNLTVRCQDTKQNQNAVTQAQNALATLGCYKRAADGCFGTNTQQAVKDFQTANQGCRITIESAQFSIPDYRITSQKPNGVITSDVWAFLKGANEGIQEQCSSSAPTPTTGYCTGDNLITCSGDGDCISQGTTGPCIIVPGPMSTEKVHGC